MTEVAQYEARLDMRQVKEELVQVRAGQDALHAQGSKLHSNLEAIDRAGREAGKGLGAMSFALGGVAGGGKEVANVLGDLAGLITAGPFAIAVTAGAAAVTAFAGDFLKIREASKQAVEDASKHLEDLKTDIKDLDFELQAMASGTTIEIAKQRAAAAKAEAEARDAIEAAGGAKAFQQMARIEERAGEVPQRFKELYDAAILATATYAKEQEKLQKLVMNEQFKKFLDDEKEAAKSAAALGKIKPLDNDTLYGGSVLPEALKAMEQQADYVAELDDKSAAHHREAVLLRVKADVAAYQAEVKAKEEADKEIAASDKKLNDELAKNTDEQMKLLENAYGAGLEAVLGGAANSFFGFLEATKEGQKNAAQAAAAAFLKSTGQQLVGLGIKNILEGGALTFAGNPAGAAIAGIGAAEIAAGAAMGAGGIALAPPSAGGGGAGGAAPTRGAGVRASGGGGGRRGGSDVVQSVTIVYGAGGYAPQETGRHVFKALNSFAASSGVPPPGSVQGPRR